MSRTQKDDDFNILDGFTWQAVIMGYGCGMLSGLITGYFIFKCEKPRWLIGFVYRIYKTIRLVKVEVNCLYLLVEEEVSSILSLNRICISIIFVRRRI